jgi:ATP-dependent DNA helicase RecG
MPSNSVSIALDLPVSERGRRLLGIAEDQWFDRKSVRIKPQKLAESICAFAHAEGGTLVIGLSEGRVEGVEANSSAVNGLRQASFDFLRPPVPVRATEVACFDEGRNLVHVLVLNIEPSEHVHETVSGDCYLRVGDENRRLTFAQRQDLEFDRGLSKYEAQRLQERQYSDLDSRLVESYRQAAGATQDAQRLLASRGLLLPDFGLTVGGYLLFARHPQDLFPSAFVRIVRYIGTSRETGARQNLESGSDVRVEGSLPDVIHEAAREIGRLVPLRRALGPGDTFVDRPIVPREAWLEGLVNAVVHRSYSIAGDHIRVEIFDDRLEITSPGRFPGLADLTRPLEVVRFARNPRIARVCFDLSITQELGEGIRRIFDEMRSSGLEDPLYEQGSSNVRLTLLSKQRISDRLAAGLPLASRELLQLLRDHARPMGTGDIESASGKSRPTVVKHLNRLRQVGLVRWAGANRNDRTAAWSAVDDDSQPHP